MHKKVNTKKFLDQHLPKSYSNRFFERFHDKYEDNEKNRALLFNVKNDRVTNTQMLRDLVLLASENKDAKEEINSIIQK